MNKLFLLLSLIFSHAAFAQHGTLKNGPIFCSTVAGAECIEDKRFNGIYKNIKFSLFSDGSATVQGYKDSEGMDYKNDWHIGCRKDVISRNKSCYVRKMRGNLFVFVYPGNRIQIFAGDKHYPRTRTSIRLNDSTFHTTADEPFPKSAAIANKMIDGTEMAIQWVEWPYGNSNDDTFDVYGFQTALTIAKWSLSNLK